MRKTLALLTTVAMSVPAMAQQSAPAKAGNPVVTGWYADPEAAIFGKTYWIFPTFSDKYEKQVFFDAFSSPDMGRWTKHPHILDTAAVKWAKKGYVGACYCRKGR